MIAYCAEDLQRYFETQREYENERKRLEKTWILSLAKLSGGPFTHGASPAKAMHVGFNLQGQRFSQKAYNEQVYDFL